MEKETLSRKLFDMLGKTILSDRTMGEYITESVLANLPEDESKLDEYLKPHIGILKSIDGQIRNNVATQIKEFQTKQSAPKEPLPEEKPIYMAEMEKSLQSMAATIQGLQEEAQRKAETQARTALIASAKELLQNEGATDDVVLKYTQALLTISDGMTSQNLAEEWKTAYNEMYAEIKGKGYEPMGGGNMDSQAGKEALLNFKEQMIKEGKLPTPPPSPLQ